MKSMVTALSKYNAPSKIEPRSEPTRNLYLAVFHDYSHSRFTLKDLAEKYGFKSVSFVGQVVKWAANYLNQLDKNVYTQQLVQDLSKTCQELNVTLDGIKDKRTGRVKLNRVGLQLQVMAELRRTKELIARAQGLMATVNFKLGSGDQPVNVIFGDFKMGVKDEEGKEAKLVEGDIQSSEEVEDGEAEEREEAEKTDVVGL